MISKRLSLLIVGGMLLCRVPVAAHHAFSTAFDENKPIKLRGTVTKVELINPHVWIWIDVNNDDGRVVSWGVEGGSPNALIRYGFTKNTLKIGTEIVVTGYQSREWSHQGVGTDITLADGRKLFLGGAVPGAVPK